MGCRWWCAVLVVNEWNIDRPLFLKVGREREGIGSGKGCQDASSVDDRHHTHAHTQTEQTAQPCQLPDSQNSAACWVSRFRHRPKSPGLHHLASVRLNPTGTLWRIMQREDRTRNGTKGLVIQLCGHFGCLGL